MLKSSRRQTCGNPNCTEFSQHLIRDHLPTHRANVDSNAPKVRGIRVDCKSAFKERNVVDAADRRVRIRFFEARRCHSPVSCFSGSAQQHSGNGHQEKRPAVFATADHSHRSAPRWGCSHRLRPALLRCFNLVPGHWTGPSVLDSPNEDLKIR